MILRTTIGRTALGALFAAAVMATAVGLHVFEPLELRGLDTLFRLRGTRNPLSLITIVDIGDDTLDALRMRWPLPRRMHGQVIEKLSAAGATAIGLDLIFPEPSAYGGADDESFAESARRARRVVMGAAITIVSEGFYVKTDANIPIPLLRQAAVGVGHTNVDVDFDGVVRRVPLAAPIGPSRFPSLAVELHRVAAVGGTIGYAVPRKPEMRINFVGAPGTFPRIPYQRVMQGDFPLEAVRGRIVLVGTTSRALRDFQRTPFGAKREMQGVEIQANALHTLLTGRGIEGVPLWGHVLIAAACAAGGAGLVGMAGVRGLGLVGAAVIAVTASAWFAFAKADVSLPIVAPSVALVLGAVAGILSQKG
jgi:CHASE2 domain-containing sensor protein